MRKYSIFLGCAVMLFPAYAPAQIAGPTPDIRNTDLGAHDTTVNPDLHDQIVNYRQRELSDKIRAQANSLGPSRAAKKDELTVGAAVNDKTGLAIAKVEQVDADGVVLSMGAAKIKVPADALGHNKAGLLLDMTKAQFEQVVANANRAF